MPCLQVPRAFLAVFGFFVPMLCLGRSPQRHLRAGCLERAQWLVGSCFWVGLQGVLWSASSAPFCDVRFDLMFRGGFPDCLTLSVGSCWHCCPVYCLRLVVFRFPVVVLFFCLFFLVCPRGWFRLWFLLWFLFFLGGACYSSGLCLRLSVWFTCLTWVAVFSAVLAAICVLAGGRVSLLGKDTSLKKVEGAVAATSRVVRKPKA